MRERDVGGLKRLQQLLPLLERLHEFGCERDKAGNRELHLDQYCLLVLLYLFDPTITSLRGIQQASELQKVQRLLGCSRASLGSLSEVATVFEADRLKEIVAELGGQLQPLNQDPRLQGISQTLTLVDATLISALPRIMQASCLKAKTGSGLVKWRLHTHPDVHPYVPERIDVTPEGGGPHDERAVMERSIDGDRLYVMDRDYAKFPLFNRIVAAGSSYVCRLRDNSVYQVLEERPLSDADRAAGIISDQIVRLTNGKPDHGPDHTLRLECITTPKHTSRGKYAGGSSGVDSDGIRRLATNLTEVPAEIVGLIFRYRWTIEIFCRFFKHVLGCRHLLSHSENGIEIQTYCAIIVCLLIALYTGRKPTLRTYEMICYYFTGLASEDELLAHLAKLQQDDEAKAKKTR